MKRATILKVLILIIFIALAVYLSQQSYVTQLLSKEGLQNFVNGFGVFGPVVYILIYAAGICLFIPGSLLTAVGGIIFGTVWGFIYTMIGAMIGSTVAFFIARYLGKEFFDNVLKEKAKKLEKYNDLLEKESFSTIFYLRMVFFPFTPLNFAAGVTKCKFKEYFWGTLLGIIPGTFIFTFFFDTITNITGIQDLLSWKIGLAVVLFVAAFFIPVLVRQHKKKILKQNN